MSLDLPSDMLESLESIVEQDAELWTEAAEASLYKAGLLLNARAAQPDEDRFVEKDYWGAFLRELRELLCTENNKYQTVRQHINEAKETTSKFIVPAIAGGIGATLGVAPAVLVPFVALALFATLKLGVNAWCKLNEEEMHQAIATVTATREAPGIDD